MNCQLKQTACLESTHGAFKAPRFQTPAQLSRVTVPRPWGRFSRMTWAASPPLARKRRAIRHCSTLVTSERSRLTSILTVGPISFPLYRVAVDSRFPIRGRSEIGCPIPLPAKAGSFLGRFL